MMNIDMTSTKKTFLWSIVFSAILLESAMASLTTTQAEAELVKIATFAKGPVWTNGGICMVIVGIFAAFKSRDPKHLGIAALIAIAGTGLIALM